jgi:hypothetical protein
VLSSSSLMIEARAFAQLMREQRRVGLDGP